MKRQLLISFCASAFVIAASIASFGQLGPFVSKKVIVPTSMRSSPFNVDRYLTVPRDFEISVYARVSGSRFLATTPDGKLLVSVPGEGKVKLVSPSASGDPTVSDFLTGLSQPHDMVFHQIDQTMYLYVTEQTQVNRYTYQNGASTGSNREIIIKGLPAGGHNLKNIALGPDHKLYLSIASSCNVCTTDGQATPKRAAFYVYNADGTNGTLFAQGIRNAEGLDFVPGTNDLWAVVNNRDEIIYPYNDATGNYGKKVTAFVDNNPPEEFIHVTQGANFGWPFCNPDPRQGLDNMPFNNDYEMNQNGQAANCAQMTKVNKGIQAHSAPLGLLFLQNSNFPSAFKNAAVVGLHGSWNRTKITGYKVIYFPWDSTTKTLGDQVDLVGGFINLDSSSAFGRPVDMAVSPTGDLLFSDDKGGTIFKLAYKGNVTSFEKGALDATSEVTLFPQPSSRQVYVRIWGEKSQNVDLSVTSLQGQAMFTLTQYMTQGENVVPINTSDWAPGTYLLKVKKGDKESAHRFIVQ